MALDTHKRAEVESRTPELLAYEATKPFMGGAVHFVEWATVAAMLEAAALPRGARLLDIGCGGGWTTLFLTEMGYSVTGYDLVGANIELARERAKRWSSPARFEVADMEELPPGEPADAALVFDALHHSTRERTVLQAIASRLRPGGWLLLCEPTWLHNVSPGARATSRSLGWVERGFTVRGLRRDLRAAGFGRPRRFFQPTRPYEGRGRAFTRQLVELVAANVFVMPRAHLWLMAQRGLRDA